MGGGGLLHFFYTTLLPFFVWCSKKGTLNYTFLHLSFKIFFFPIIFSSVFTKNIFKGKTRVKHTFCEIKMSLNYTCLDYFTLHFFTLHFREKKCSDPPPPPPPPPPGCNPKNPIPAWPFIGRGCFFGDTFQT